MTKTLTAAVSAVLLMMLTACGGGSDSESSSDTSSSSATTSAAASDDDATAATAISDGLMGSQKSGGANAQLLTMSRKDADCLGEGMVDKVGTKQLQKYGMLTEDLKTGTNMSSLKMSSADANSTADVMFSCTDVEAMMRTALDRTGTIPKELKGCVNQVVTKPNLRPMFVKIFQGRTAAAQKELATPLLACAKKARQ